MSSSSSRGGGGAGDPAREAILARLRSASGNRIPHPTPEKIPEAALGWDDFKQALAEADGELHPPVERRDLPQALSHLAGGPLLYAHGAARFLGEAPAPGRPDILAGAPALAASGRMAVARTGSVVVTQEEVPVRAHLLLPETLFLLVREGSLVDDLPAVYARLDPGALARGYFTLVSGPSRTADIEQTLVTGAHGPRRLVVVPYRD
jgi:hypothetical protein